MEVLKPEQEETIRAFVNGNVVFVCLPTGYGKSCFGILPFIYDYLRGPGNSGDTSMNPSYIVVCVSPLQSIMKDQYQKFKCHGLSAEFVGGTRHEEEYLDNVRDGKAQMVYISPEALLQWREILQSQVYQDNLVAFAVDEVPPRGC